MTTLHDAILEGEHLTWLGTPPRGTGPMRVRVAVESELDASNGRELARILEDIAVSTGGIRSITDPVRWQHEQRQDRQLPGRDQ